VVGVAKVGQLPAKRLNGGISGSARRGRLGADDGVLAVRFVPYGNHLNAGLKCLDAGLQLRLGLVRETVSGSNGILGKFQTFLFHVSPD
jgi:hypothetical protein